MQQTELFAARPVKSPAAPYLRLVHPRLVQSGEKVAQPVETIERVVSASVREKTAEATVIRTASSRSALSTRRRSAGLRSFAPEHVERFLNHLHGEALLVGALSYDLGLRLSQLRFLRVRDVNLSARVIELSDGAKQIPAALFEDLKEHISARGSGCEVGRGVAKRDQLLFSHEAFESVLRVCASFFANASQAANSEESASELTISGLHAELGQRVRDNFLRVMGWFHRKRAAKRGAGISSPLGLFDKGPKIVRRDRGGVVHSYYLWRAVYSR